MECSNGEEEEGGREEMEEEECKEEVEKEEGVEDEGDMKEAEEEDKEKSLEVAENSCKRSRIACESDTSSEQTAAESRTASRLTILHGVYGTSTSGGKKSKVGSHGEKGKGKEKGEEEMVMRERSGGDGAPQEGNSERTNKGGIENEGESSSEDSDVEWDDVALPTSSMPPQLQAHGFVGHRVSIPIELSSQVRAERRKKGERERGRERVRGRR